MKHKTAEDIAKRKRIMKGAAKIRMDREAKSRSVDKKGDGADSIINKPGGKQIRRKRTFLESVFNR